MARRATVIRFPKAPPGSPDPRAQFIEVRRCQDQAEALVVKALLQSDGIQVVMRSHVAQSVHPFSVGDQAQIVVLVPAADADRARTILDG